MFKKFLIINVIAFSQALISGPLDYVKKLHMYSLSNELEEYKKAFDAFEPEASQVRVKIATEYCINGDKIITHTYTPETKHLAAYLSAYKNFISKLSVIAVVNGILTGALIGTLASKLLSASTAKTILDVLPEKAPKSCGFLFFASMPLLGALPIVLENKLRGKVAYFDYDTMQKHDNLFNLCNKPSFDRIIAAGVTAPFIILGALIIKAAP